MSRFFDKDNFIEDQKNYWKERYGIVDLKEEIKKRIGTCPEYIGFDMSKTHSQEEKNLEIDKHNEAIINQFSDLLGRHTNKIVSMFDVWKGMVFFSENKDYNTNIKDFGGWTSEDILYWLLTEGNFYIIKKEFEKEDKEMNDMWKEIESKENKKVYRIITYQDRYNVLKRQKWKCNQCGGNLKFRNSSSWEGETAHIDHIHPYTERGSYLNGEENINELSNLQALCPKCNLRKGKKKIQ